MENDFKYYVNKTERRFILFSVLSFFIMALMAYFFIAPVYQEMNTSLEKENNEDSLARTVLPHEGKRSILPPNERWYSSAGQQQQAERFPFDPNTADSTEFARLGFSYWQIHSIYRYRQRGGVYRLPSDIADIYGMTVKQYRELLPFVRISNDYKPAVEFVKASQLKPVVGYDTLQDIRKLLPGETVDINHADTTELKRIPGVGSYYARRIMEYRQRLGGFVSPSQLLDIQGLSPVAEQYARVESGVAKKVHINTMTVEQLARHPYIRFRRARAIVEYRRLYGELNSAADLQKLHLFTSEEIQQLMPYLEFR